MDQKDQLSALMQETQRRKRLKTDLSEFDDRLKEMMRLNISLPVIVDWLSKQGRETTLQAFRRYVKRVFGDDHYDEFLKRNGWMKSKDKKEEKKTKQPVNTLDGIQKSTATTSITGEVEGEKKDAGVSEIHKILSAPSQKYPARKK